MSSFLRSLGIGAAEPAPPPSLDSLSLRGAPIPMPGDSEAGAPWNASLGTSLAGSDLVRIWPPATAGGQRGDGLGYLRFAPRTPATAQRIDCATAYALTLDPEWSAPNARIAVSFGPTAPVRRAIDAVLRPGQTMPRPAGFSTFWFYNADGIEQVCDLAAQPANAPLGYCAFLLSTTPGAPPVFRVQPHPAPQSAVIQAGALSTYVAAIKSPASTALYFSPMGLSAVRVYLAALDAGGNLTTANQWSAEIALFALAHASVTPGGLWVGPPSTETADIAAISAATQTGVWTRHAMLGVGGGSDPVGAPNGIIDAGTIAVPHGALAAQLALSFTGALRAPGGVPTSLYAIVEGIPSTTPPPPPSRRPVVLYDFTSGAAAALDTGSIGTADFDALYVDALASAGTMQLSPFEVSNAGVNRAVATPPAAAIAQQGAWGLGAAVPTGFAATAWAVPYPVPRRVRFTTGAAAAGTVRLRVLGVRSGFGR